MSAPTQIFLENKLRDLGVFHYKAAVAAARRIGLTYEEINHIVERYEAEDKQQPALLCWRLRNAHIQYDVRPEKCD